MNDSSTSTHSDQPRVAAVLVAKLAAFALIVLALQWALFQITGSRTASEHAHLSLITGRPAVHGELSIQYLHDLAGSRPDVLFLGDSTTDAIPEGPGLTTPELLQRELAASRVAGVLHAGFHGRTYHTLYRYMQSLSGSIEVVVVPLNVRTFGREWYASERYEFGYLHRSLDLEMRRLGFLQHPMRVFGMDEQAPEPPAPRRRAALPTNLYDFSIGSSHPVFDRLLSLRDAVEADGGVLVTYLNPLHYTYMREELGAETESMARGNVAAILDFCARHGIRVIDLSEAVPESDIVVVRGTLGHLNESGRAQVAGALAEYLLGEGLVGGG